MVALEPRSIGSEARLLSSQLDKSACLGNSKFSYDEMIEARSAELGCLERYIRPSRFQYCVSMYNKRLTCFIIFSPPTKLTAINVRLVENGTSYRATTEFLV